MCGIAGFFHPNGNYTSFPEKWESILRRMNQIQKHRGPDDDGILLTPICGFAHVRLSILDLQKGHQPMTRNWQGQTCSIIFNGEIYNMPKLRRELLCAGCSFETTSDTEVILMGYLCYGEAFIQKLNGIFAIALFEHQTGILKLFRDRLGVKPLFYTRYQNTFVFSSEIKGLFAYPNISPKIDTISLQELFALGPARTPGTGVFCHIRELLPGQCLTLQNTSVISSCYWHLKAYPHQASPARTIQKTTHLLTDAIRTQMLSDIPISTFLSGGIDSSLITAICATILGQKGKSLATYSFDFLDNHIYFQPSSFQPSEDFPYVRRMVRQLHTNHRFLTCDSQKQLSCLFPAVKARDLPCMADVESSLFYFCSQVALQHKVVLTGECADEIFGGYPWFRDPFALLHGFFPWAKNMKLRNSLLKDELIEDLALERYARTAFTKTIQEAPILPDDSNTQKQARQMAWLNLRWFMATLLERLDRTSMYHGLEARVPFADHRLVELLYNLPPKLKCLNGMTKGLLRKSASSFLPRDILLRKKSPYPKSYDPQFERLLILRLKDVLDHTNAPIHSFLDIRKVHRFLDRPLDRTNPWYGQLMAEPQLLAYLLQINYWLEEYHVRIP